MVEMVNGMMIALPDYYVHGVFRSQSLANDNKASCIHVSMLMNEVLAGHLHQS